MDILTEQLKKKFGSKYDYLKLFDVVYDKENMECIATFLYPMTMKEMSEESREEIEDFVSSYLSLNAKTKVKFKKSFCDERLLRRDVKRFIDDNFKAISVYLSEDQIKISENEDGINVSLLVGEQIKKFYEANKVSSAIHKFLLENNIGKFSVDAVLDKNFEIQEEIEDVEVVVEAKRRLRYKVEPINKIVGNDIPPEPEFIKNQDKPKEGVILAGYVAGLNQKEFIVKKGRMAGQTKRYYTFTIDDGKKIDCVYFCSKKNENFMDGLENNMFVLCLGNTEIGFNGKLTYYLKHITFASQIDNLVEMEEEEEKNTIDSHKQVVYAQKYNYTKQDDLFAENIKYNDYILENSFVIYDLETTGLDPQNDEIIEIGAVKIVDGKVDEYFSSFVKPTKPIPEETTKINNITNEMVKDAPPIKDVLIDFYRFCSACVVGGYNSDDFDNKFIKANAKKIGFNFYNDFIDVMKISRTSKIAPKNFKLISVCKYLGIDLVGAHRAYNDAFATAQVLLKLNEIS